MTVRNYLQGYRDGLSEGAHFAGDSEGDVFFIETIDTSGLLMHDYYVFARSAVEAMELVRTYLKMKRERRELQGLEPDRTEIVGPLRYATPERLEFAGVTVEEAKEMSRLIRAKDPDVFEFWG